MSSYTANNKLIYTWNKGSKRIPTTLLSSYAESIIFDGDKRTIWYKGRQFGNTYYGSDWGETFNDVATNAALGTYSHAEGAHNNVTVTAEGSHAEGAYNKVSGKYSHVEGLYNTVVGNCAHACGTYTIAHGEGSLAQGTNTYAGNGNYSYAHAEGIYTSAYGIASHTEGATTFTSNAARSAHAEGEETGAYAIASHAEGSGTKTYGTNSHAEGSGTIANGNGAHTEGYNTYAEGYYSHTEGIDTYTNGYGSHAEGYNSYAEGMYSHANGYGTYAVGNSSFTTGKGTVAHYDFSTVVGKYNTYSPESLFAVGDGIDVNNRHNAIEVTSSYTYIGNKSYFGDNVFAPLTYSYVNYTGADKSLDLLIRALLDDPEYVRPTLYTKFSYTNDYYPSYITNGSSVVKVEMEIGSYFHPSLRIYWPSVDEDKEIASRMSTKDQTPDYNTIEPYRLGYSYGAADGTNALSFVYNYCTDWSISHTEAQAQQVSAWDAPRGFVTAAGYTYINGEDDYTVIDNITFAYKGSSYMIYNQLRKVGLTQISYGGNSTYFGDGIVNIPQKLVVGGRYKWFCGFSDVVPAGRAEMDINGGFLTKNYTDTDIYTTCEYAITKDDMKKKIFWCACPEEFELVPYNNGYKDYNINICRGNSINFDLVSDIQEIKTSTVSIPLGMYLYYDLMQPKKYTIYYIVFEQWTLGDSDNDVVKFKFKRK